MDMNDIAGHHDVLSRFALSERAEPALSSGSPTPDLSTSKCSYQDEPTGGPCRGSDPVGCDQPLGYVGVVPFGIARWWPNSNQAVCVGRGLSQQDGQQPQKLQVQPEKRTGDDACPFTTLYWDFLARDEEALPGNHRVSRELAAMRRLSNLPAIRERAQVVLAALDNGTL